MFLIYLLSVLSNARTLLEVYLIILGALTVMLCIVLIIVSTRYTLLKDGTLISNGSSSDWLNIASFTGMILHYFNAVKWVYLVPIILYFLAPKKDLLEMIIQRL
nr:MAG TPA: hypothetical protein [Caudoviricetes sp.]